MALGLIGGLVAFLNHLDNTIILQEHQIEDMKEEIHLLKRVAGCDEEEEESGISHWFNWATLECKAGEDKVAKKAREVYRQMMEEDEAKEKTP